MDGLMIFIVLWKSLPYWHEGLPGNYSLSAWIWFNNAFLLKDNEQWPTIGHCNRYDRSMDALKIQTAIIGGFDWGARMPISLRQSGPKVARDLYR